jgi:chorismate mutase/prephenate dehydratase
MNLNDYRKQIDALDAKLVDLIAQRILIAERIGQTKQELGRSIEDVDREESKLSQIREMARKYDLNEIDVECVFRSLICASRSRQGIIVAFQGESGAYSEEAALSFFGQNIETKPFENLENVFDAVTQNQALFGIVPVENSLEGSIARTYDLLLESSLMVSGEIELRVSHCLIANPETSLASIRRIFSHPQALGQSQAFIKKLGVDLIPTYDTAGAVKYIKENNIKDGAAIGSARAAEIYCMKILVREIEDNRQNFTRFFVLSKSDSPPSSRDKTSIVFSVKHKPGALFDLLKDLASNNINLTKIESRPTRRKAWDYNFYLDFEGHRLDINAQKALSDLEEQALFVKVLGSYPKTKPREEC